MSKYRNSTWKIVCISYLTYIDNSPSSLVQRDSPVKLYPGHGLKRPAPFLLDWLATSDLASLWRFLWRSQFFLKHSWLQKKEPCNQNKKTKINFVHYYYYIKYKTSIGTSVILLWRKKNKDCFSPKKLNWLKKIIENGLSKMYYLQREHKNLSEICYALVSA